ncbi:transposase [Paenibacillus sp. 1_12]|uniref:transposase n=1 Tax=Paenibacillus sp. 1_12 TaxID=1566278 RepID=UPI0011602678
MKRKLNKPKPYSCVKGLFVLKRRKYDKAFKVEAVLQVLEEGRKVPHVAKSLHAESMVIRI